MKIQLHLIVSAVIAVVCSDPRCANAAEVSELEVYQRIGRALLEKVENPRISESAKLELVQRAASVASEQLEREAHRMSWEEAYALRSAVLALKQSAYANSKLSAAVLRTILSLSTR